MCGPPSRQEEGLGKLGFEAQESWGCVCEGGGGGCAPSNPWKLEGAPPQESESNASILDKKAPFYTN